MENLAMVELLVRKLQPQWVKIKASKQVKSEGQKVGEGQSALKMNQKKRAA
jgi:hypothetical protein